MTTENTTPEDCADSTELDKREWHLIEHLGECANAHEKAGERCAGHRTILVAQLMFELQLDVYDIGFVAAALIDLQEFVDEEVAKDEKKDNVIEAGEAFNQ